MSYMNLDAEGLDAIRLLVSRRTICSVACYYRDPPLWVIFLNEQVKRAKRRGLPPQVTFSLCGPDTGLSPAIDPAAMGGDVHIPYEGITGGDLFIQPEWRLFHPDRANAAGSLCAGNFGKECHVLLTATNYGNLRNSRRSEIGKYLLYESTLPYRPSDPLGERARYASQQLDVERPLATRAEDLRGWFDGQHLPAIFPMQ